MAQLLMDYGALPGPIDLERAAHYGGIKMLQALMSNGSRFDYDTNKTILHNGSCSPEIIQLIINEMPQMANTREVSGCNPSDTIYDTLGDYYEENTIPSTAASSSLEARYPARTVTTAENAGQC